MEDPNNVSEQVRAIVEQHKPADMSTQKVLDRIATMAVLNGVTRTNLLGAVCYAALYGPLVGLTVEQLTEILKGAYTAAASVPEMAELAAEYKIQNETALKGAIMPKMGTVVH